MWIPAMNAGMPNLKLRSRYFREKRMLGSGAADLRSCQPVAWFPSTGREVTRDDLVSVQLGERVGSACGGDALESNGSKHLGG